jgi:hypothetical protein
MSDEQRDFFISFNSADETYAKAISDALRAEGFTTFFHPEDLELGGYIPKWMNDALLNSRQMLALCSPEYVESSSIYSEAERYARFWQNTRGENFKLIPVVLKEVQLPPLMAPYKRIVATNMTPAQAAAAVVSALAKTEQTKERETLQKTQPIATTHQPTYVHTTRLPEPPYEHLVGREAELQRLDEAWVDAKTNILSLIAEGGVGKTALVCEWIRRMQANSYPGAEVVLGWSLDDQDTVEVKSADELLNWLLDILGIALPTTKLTAQADAIAEAMMRRRVLLVLDGIEPLQHETGPQLGQLKDIGLRTLLRRFAATPPNAAHGLIVLTSRLAVKDISAWRDRAAPVIVVGRISDAAGAVLLRDNGVTGTDEELVAAARDFGDHPRTLGLLASFLRETQGGDVRRRDLIHTYITDPTNPHRERARRVVESYENWLTANKTSKQTGSEGRPVEAVESQSDEPTSDDQLGRRPFAQALVERLDKLYEKGAHNGFAAHIHAPWGAGKTSVLMMMRELMTATDRKSSDGKIAPEWVVIEFNAWKHERRNPPWWPLMEQVKAGCIESLSEKDVGWLRLCRACLRNLRSFGNAQDCDQAAMLQAHWMWWKIRTDAVAYFLAFFVTALCLWMLLMAGGTTLELILKVFTASILAFASFLTASRVAFFGSATAAKLYEDIAHDPLKRIASLFTEIVDKTGKPVCVFIDDLDRCSAAYVVDLLEGIQTSFRHRNVAYVVAADRSWIKASFEKRYDTFATAVGNLGQPLGYLFLEKIFQVSTPVPGMGDRTRSSYWNRLVKGVRGTEDIVKSSLSPGQDKKQFDETVQEKRELLREEHGEELTRAQAEEALRKSDGPEDRAAVVLELNASRAADREAEHLLVRFTGLLPDNPRVMKRMVNAFAMRQAIGLLERNPAPAAILARWTILEQRFPALADLLIEHPEWTDILDGNIKDQALETPPEPLVPFSDSEVIRDIIGAGDHRMTVEHVRSITRGSAT